MTETTPLPAGWCLTPTDGLRTAKRWTTLLGWSPSTLLRLSQSGAHVAKRILAGEPLANAANERSLARRLERAGMATAVPPRDDQPRPFSVVIPSHNDRAEVERTIARLTESVPRALREIIVVDDGGSPALALNRTDITTIRLPTNQGPAAARNAGALAATGQTIAFVDAGVEIAADALGQLATYLNDPETIAVAPRIRSEDDGASNIAAYEKTASPLDLGDRPAIVRSRSRVAYVPSACLVVDRVAFHSLRGFDEQMRFGEDVDLVWRLASCGTVRYASSITAFHRPRGSIPDFVRQRRTYGSSAAALAARHPSEFVPLIIEKWGALSLALLFAGHPVLAAAPLLYRSKVLADALPEGLDDRLPLALSLVGRGQLALAKGLVESLMRPYAPLALVGLIISRRMWAPLGLGLALRAKGQLSFPAGIALTIVDDVAYSAGVWQGAMRHRSARCLIPEFR